MSQPNSKDSNGHYYAQYVINTPPKGTDATLWSVAMSEYLERNGIEHVTANTTVANVDFPEVRRLYNRILDEGKQRRTNDSTPPPMQPVRATESDD